MDHSQEKTAKRYEAPEIFELGDASQITLGEPNKPCADNCDCRKDGGEGEIILA